MMQSMMFKTNEQDVRTNKRKHDEFAETLMSHEKIQKRKERDRLAVKLEAAEEMLNSDLMEEENDDKKGENMVKNISRNARIAAYKVLCKRYKKDLDDIEKYLEAE